MASNEYVEQINKLMDLQIEYLNIFLLILTVVIGVMGFFQWKLSDKQINTIKNDMDEKISKKYKKDLDEAIKKNEEQFLEAVRLITFSSIETLILIEFRFDYLAEKTSTLLKNLEGVDSINSEEADLLRKNIDYTFEIIEDYHESDFDELFQKSIPYIENTLAFITNKGPEFYKEYDKDNQVLIKNIQRNTIEAFERAKIKQEYESK